LPSHRAAITSGSARWRAITIDMLIAGPNGQETNRGLISNYA
jgi:hypothetical protein